ncbi:alpha/beta hydrolase [Nocardiopsis sp. HNM0947]|uniref:Alpha/beta hydrolase n=1 Tax=Nocardiopsis coralli TaxID=2772213 RepID=A0ABR9P237_9ACTN|nr:lipase family protein [Nocardiopsis coralli]MBE2997904.1 alpha/beta hydrolase [Nocardiopsis coralli]
MGWRKGHRRRRTITSAAVLSGLLVTIPACAGVQGANMGTGAAPAQNEDAVQEAREAQEANALPRDEFYTGDVEAGDPGTLARSEAFDGWEALGDNAVGNRMVYRSLDSNGEPSVASAAVVTPDGTPPEGGWPVVAWAHGTSGVSPDCAPSLMKDLYYGDLVQALVDRNYAVVATDYSGLGAGEAHEYDTMTPNANDVRYSVSAAREAVDGLSERWVSMGHSQGGQAAWGAARQQADDPVGEMVGAVAYAPAAPIIDSIREVDDAPGSGAYAPYVAYSLNLQYPDEIEPGDVLSDAALEHYDEITQEACLALAVEISGEATPSEYFRDGWDENPVVQRFQEDNIYSDQQLGAPLFAATGSEDTAVPARLIEEAAQEQCSHDTAVQYQEYPGDHDGMMDAASSDAMQWVQDRFDGKDAPSNCE